MNTPYPADTRAKGWRFEIDTEAVKASDTWLRARIGAVRGALLLLWSEAWQQTPCGSLPDDDELVALLIDMPTAAFARHRSVLMRGWSRADDGRLYHETITKRVLAMLEKRAKDAKRASDKRERIADAAATHTEVTSASRVTPARSVREFDTKHQAPSTNEEIPPSGERGKPRPAKKAPAGFAVDAEMRRWAAENTPGIDVDAETAKFRDHTFATTCIDWPGRWRNWLRKAPDFGPRGAPIANRQLAVEAENRRVAAQWLQQGETA